MSSPLSPFYFRVQPGLLILLVSAMLIGCGQHPKATSRESMDFIKQLYTACNTKNPERLTACIARLSVLESEGKISKKEIVSFQRVLKLAQSGEWESAQSVSLQYAQDQVR